MDRISDKIGGIHVTPAEWERRRYEIARDIYVTSGMNAEQSVKRADYLIKELKKQINEHK